MDHSAPPTRTATHVVTSRSPAATSCGKSSKGLLVSTEPVTAPDRDEQAKSFVGMIAAFYPSPTMVKLCLPQPNAKRYHGTVIAASPDVPAQPSAISDFALSVRGRTGKVARVSLVNHYVSLYRTWPEALADGANPRG